MKNIFKPGDIKKYSRTVNREDLAKFDSGTVHELYSTFAIARDAEWCTRLFVLEMNDEDEEGIGTFVNVEHIAGAKVGAEISIISKLIEVDRNEVTCVFEVKEGERLLAKGKTGQKILKKEKLEKLFNSL